MVCAATRLKVGKKVDNFADANRDRGVYAYGPVPLDDHGRFNADVALHTRTVDTGELVAIAVFEVEGPHRSGRCIVENAARVLNNVPTVECVVCIKFFAPRSRARQEVNEECVPALLVVFRRCPPGLDRWLGRIELVESCSFGNIGNDAQGLSFICTPRASPLIANPLHNIDHLQEHSPAFPEGFEEANFDAALDRALARARGMGRRAWNPIVQVDFPVRVCPQLPPVHLDLAEVYIAGVRATRVRAGRAVVQERDGWVVTTIRWARSCLGL
jgi:hypothetical protein